MKGAFGVPIFHHVPYRFPIQWGAGRSYLEFPNHLVGIVGIFHSNIVGESIVGKPRNLGLEFGASPTCMFDPLMKPNFTNGH